MVPPVVRTQTDGPKELTGPDDAQDLLSTVLADRRQSYAPLLHPEEPVGRVIHQVNDLIAPDPLGIEGVLEVSDMGLDEVCDLQAVVMRPRLHDKPPGNASAPAYPPRPEMSSIFIMDAGYRMHDAG
jgi:hypothetical protein